MIATPEYNTVRSIGRVRGKGIMAKRKRDRLTGCQARAARAMLMWSVNDLAKHCGLSASSIRRIEGEFGVPKNVTLDLLERLLEYYERRGFLFSWNDSHGPGVAWAMYLGGQRAGDAAQDPG